MKLDSLYQEIILDHYKHPHGRGLREPYDAEVHHVNPTCGDEVTLRVRVADGVVEDVSYEGAGCSISQASTSVLTDLVVGKPVAGAMAVQEEFLRLMQSKGAQEPDAEVLEDAVAFAGVSKYPSRVKCALLGWMAWKDATVQATAQRAGQGEAVGTRESAVSEREGSQRERGATRPGRPAAPRGGAEMDGVPALLAEEGTR